MSALRKFEPVEKSQPHSHDSERQVLALVLSYKKHIATALETLTPGDFYHTPYSIVFASVARLTAARKPVDVLTVCEDLGPSLEAAGGRDAIHDLPGSIPHGYGLEYHAGVVLEKSRLRAIIRHSAETLEAAFEHGAESAILAAETTAAMGRIDSASAYKSSSPAELSAWYYERLERRMKDAAAVNHAIKAPWYSMNKLCELRRGNLAFIAGRPSMGKTMLALSYAWHVAKTHDVLFFSLEMDRDEILDRLAIGETTVKGASLADSDIGENDWLQLGHFATQVGSSGLHIPDTLRLSAANVRSEARRMTAAGRPPVLIVIDYLELMTLPSAERHDLRLGALCFELKAIAREFKCVVLPLCQLSREVEKRQNKRPMLSDLKNSGDIEASADVVALIYRDDYYATRERRVSTDPGVCEIDFAKHRNGATGTVKLDIDIERQTFKEPRSDF